MTELVKNIIDLKKHIAIDFIEGYEVLQPMIEDAERKLKKEYVGAGLWAKLVAEYASPGSETNKYVELLWFAQRIICNFALLDYVPEGQLDISTNGIRITTTNEKKTAFEWQIQKLEKKYSDTAYRNIELMLQFLNENIKKYDDWTSSAAYVANKGRFVNSAIEFHRFVDINKSHLTFLKLLATIDLVEDNIIRSMLGDEFYDELKERIKDGEDVDSSSDSSSSSATAEDLLYDKLFYLISGAVAHFTAASHDELLGVDQDKSEKNASLYAGRLVEFLNNTASTSLFKKYFESKKYIAPEESSSFTSGGGIDNSGFTGVFGAF